MKVISFLLLTICSLSANAQNYFISYTGTGGSTTVETVYVENLSSGLTASLNGSDVLHLTGTVGVFPVENKQSMGLKPYPNPTNDYSTIEVYPPVTGDAVISIYDMTGKQVFKTLCYLENSQQDLQVSGIKKGIFLISIKGSTYQYSGKLSCNAESVGIIKIEKVGDLNPSFGNRKSEMDSKGNKSIVDMVYTNGDILKFTGKSGIYSSAMVDIPSADKTVLFEFTSCTDGNNNNYPTIKIGSQIWMAENLRATKYSDGTEIPHVTDPILWRTIDTDAYCFYNNNGSFIGTTYGALYNYYAVNTNKLCPVGWRVPEDGHWGSLIDHLGGLTPACGKLKEQGTAHWASPNTADNSSGFSAPGGGYRDSGSGAFQTLTYRAIYWSATPYISITSWCREFFWTPSYISRIAYGKRSGYSIRCIKEL